MGIIHRGNSTYVIFDGVIKKKCRYKHAKEDADMCGECIRLNGIDVYPKNEIIKKKRKKN